MSILSIALRLEQRQQSSPSQKKAARSPSYLWLQAVTLVFATFTVLIVSTISTSSLHPLPSIFDLPEAYLPGNPLPPLPKEAECSVEYAFTACPVPYLDKLVYVYIQQGTRMISSTSMRVHEYTLGDLIENWGTPTGITRNQPLITIYWGQRSALVYTDSLRPESAVEFLAYDLSSRQAEPWRGFTTHKR